MPYPRINTRTASARQTNAITTATIAAPNTPDQRWYIPSAMVTVSGGIGDFAVMDGTTVIWQGHVTSTAPFSQTWDPPLQASPNGAVSIVCQAAGVGNQSSVNIQAFLQ